MNWNVVSTGLPSGFQGPSLIAFATAIIPFQTPAQTHIRRVRLSAERYLTEQKRPPGSIQNLQGGKRQMLRSIRKAYEMIKAEDAESAVTVHTIRTWCKEGKIKHLTVGTKILVDMDSLLTYINPNRG